MNFQQCLIALSFLICGAPYALKAEEPTVVAVGDIMLSGSGNSVYRRKGYEYAFAATESILKSADVTVGNLEAPLTKGGQEFTEKQFRFRSYPEAAKALKKAGFTVLTLANNHMLDFGRQGLSDTLKALDGSGIAHTGAGINISKARQEALVTAKGKKIAFLAYSMTFPVEFHATPSRAGTAPGLQKIFCEDIAKAGQSVDYVVVSFHWGAEKATEPKDYQIAAAHAAIDAGADLIIGHHPHVLQGIEIYRDKIILYSLGNFTFGCVSPTCDRSVIARITLGPVPEAELIPINVLNSEVKFRPVILAGKDSDQVMEKLNTLCEPLGTRINQVGKRYLVQPITETVQKE